MTSRAARGISHILLGSTVQTLLRLVVIGVLARHLTPADFGVVAAAMFVLAVVDLEGALGVAPALIQRDELEPRHLETGQSLALIVAALLGSAIYLASGLVADLLSTPQSARAIEMLSLVVVLRTATSVSEAMLYRQLEFYKIAVMQVASYFFGYVVVGVGLALLGFGYWSLIYAEVARALALGLLNIWQSPPPPRLGFDRQIVRELLGFGLNLSASKMIRQLIVSIDQAVVARLFGPAELGFYVRAQGATSRPINSLGGALEAVLFPMVATIQHDTERVRAVFARGMGIYYYILIPVVGTSAILAHELIHVMLGPGWDKAATLMQLMSAGFFFRTANRLCGTILKSRGRTTWMLLLTFSQGALVAIAVVLGTFSGVEGFAIAMSGAQILHHFISIALVNSDLQNDTRRTARVLGGAIPIAILPLCIGTVVHATLSTLGAFWALNFVISGTAVAATWFASLALTPLWMLGPDGADALQAVSKMIPKKLPLGRQLRTLIARTPA